jgi:hypothetical protein
LSAKVNSKNLFGKCQPILLKNIGSHKNINKSRTITHTTNTTFFLHKLANILLFSEQKISIKHTACSTYWFYAGYAKYVWQLLISQEDAGTPRVNKSPCRLVI